MGRENRINENVGIFEHGANAKIQDSQNENFGNQGFQLLLWKPKMGIELLRALSIGA